MTDDFIEELAVRMKTELPGLKAQYKMSPIGRSPEVLFKQSGKASILILLYLHKEELWTVLMKRTVYPGHHSGQISFPGGKSEKKDTSPANTALREAREETGIDPEKIRILGTLTPLHIPVSNIEVLPVVGYTGAKPEFRLSRSEVEYLIHIPVRELIKGKIITERTIMINGESVRVPGYLVREEYVWGATAMILAEFIEIATLAWQANQ
jgi:8-oxo-dGTP pyrophosphatase MutT (NUDIX family)